MDILIEMSPVDLVHYTVDLDDPSCGVCLSSAAMKFSMTMLTNQPLPPGAPATSALALRRPLPPEAEFVKRYERTYLN